MMYYVTAMLLLRMKRMMLRMKMRMYVSRQGLGNQLERNIQSSPMNTERSTTQYHNTF